jgi:hypothetical protein
MAVMADNVGNDMDGLEVGSANVTALVVQQALRARSLQRVGDTMVGFRVDK